MSVVFKRQYRIRVNNLSASIQIKSNNELNIINYVIELHNIILCYRNIYLKVYFVDVIVTHGFTNFVVLLLIYFNYF